MKPIRYAALIAILLSSSASAQVPTCPDGSACQLANAIVEHIVEHAGHLLDGRTIFIDRESFVQAGTLLPSSVGPEQVGATLEVPFRSDVAIADLHTPAAGHSPRWGADPYLIRLDSIVGDAERATAYIQLRFNVRVAAFPDAPAGVADFRKGVQELEVRNGRWTVVRTRQLTGG